MIDDYAERVRRAVEDVRHYPDGTTARTTHTRILADGRHVGYADTGTPHGPCTRITSSGCGCMSSPELRAVAPCGRPSHHWGSPGYTPVKGDALIARAWPPFPNCDDRPAVHA